MLSDLALPCRIKSLEIGDDLFAYLRWISVAQCSDRNSKSVEQADPVGAKCARRGPNQIPDTFTVELESPNDLRE